MMLLQILQGALKQHIRIKFGPDDKIIVRYVNLKPVIFIGVFRTSSNLKEHAIKCTAG